MRKHQIPNTKHQTNSKSQYPNSKHLRILNLGHWDLFGIWDLGFGILILCLIFSFLLLNSPAEATSRYPIKELGNCRDTRECRLYCQIPANSPACWSYGKYILHPNVLGEATANITYPIPSLDNCKSAATCFQYCTQPVNQAACIAFGKAHGLTKEASDTATLSQKVLEAAKTTLGCDSKEACRTACNEPANMEKCANFAQKHNLKLHPSDSKTDIAPQVLARAKKALSCTSQQSCMVACQKPENMDACMQFAQKNKLLNAEKIKNYEEYKENKQKIITAAKEKLGCESYDTCASFCAQPENKEKCAAFISQTPTPSPNQTGCESEAECKAFCKLHPDKCPGYPTTIPQNYIFPSVKPQSSLPAVISISPTAVAAP